MIDKNGNAKIMDFGIARSLRDKGMTGAGVMIGTPTSTQLWSIFMTSSDLKTHRRKRLHR